MQYTFKRISLREFHSLDYECQLPSLSKEWLTQWFNEFEQKKNNAVGYKKVVHIIIILQDEEIISLLPLLCVQRRYLGFISIRFLEFLGQQWASLGNDLISQKMIGDDFMTQFRYWLTKNVSYHFLFLKYLPEKSVFAKNYKFYKHGGAPEIEIFKYDNYLQFKKERYSTNLKKNLKKAQNKTIKNGIQVEETVERINEFNLKEIKRISKTKLIDGKSFVYGDKNKESFYRFVYQNYESNVVFIKFNGVAVSYRTNIIYNGNKYCIDAAFDRKYRAYNLGVWTVDASLKDSFERGIQLHSMGPGFDQYKFKFADSITHYHMCIDGKYNLISLLFLPYIKSQLKRKDENIKEELQKLGYS